MTEQTRIQWTADSILDFLRTHRDELRAMGVVKIGLFGSYARGAQRPDSDIDILVKMRTPSYRDYMAVRHFLEDHLGGDIDLGEEDYLREEIRPTVMREVRYISVTA